ncbi:hypothetical protein ABZ403_10430 [Micromonospora zamorensis]|uniref:hypothetical protein n=1 Tax=Micromonospora zamorensis TaxID=709883 RepID=UPI0033FF17BD
MAGLMAARVLSDHAEEVLIIERDPSDVGDLLFRTSLTDPVLNARLGRVTTMLDHPATLSRPGTLLRALRLGLFRGSRR